MASTNRTGRVSAIDYAAGTYEVTYFDRGQSVTRKINAMSNGEYKMPTIGQIVSVSHNSNGTAAATTTGTVWNATNKPAEGYKGLYRKEYGTKSGQAYDRYDENTGVFTQYVDKRTGRTCNGEIYDEAKGSLSLIAGGQAQLSGNSVSIQARKGMTLAAGNTLSLEAKNVDVSADEHCLAITGESKETIDGKVTRTFLDGIEETITGEVVININGASITISPAGDITVSSPTKINLAAPEINVEAAAGDIKVKNISLVTHTHTCADPESKSSAPLP